MVYDAFESDILYESISAHDVSREMPALSQ